MAISASALEIVSPSEQTYFTGLIDLNITSNQTLDSVLYSIDSAANITGCQNCSAFNGVLNLSNGNHTIEANGILGNETFFDSTSFAVEESVSNETNETLPVVNFSIEIIEPKNLVYNSTEINVSVSSNETVDNLSVKLDSGSYEVLCSNCSSYSKTINVSTGGHTLSAKGSKSSVEKEKSVSFSVVIPSEPVVLSLLVNSPEAKNYTSKNILLNFSTNLDSTIRYSLDGNNYTACGACKEFSSQVEVSFGSHNLLVNASTENQTDSKTMEFSVINVSNGGNNTPKNNSKGNSTFTKGFEKLPKMIEAGEISDEELAQIIRNNKLNPGVLNRLIKTGKLGPDSIDAILDTQFLPQGILRKLLAFFGISQKTYPELIIDYYDVTEKAEQKIISREDLSEKYADKIEKNLEKKIENEIKSGSGNSGNSGKGNSDEGKKGNSGKSEDKEIEKVKKEEKENKGPGKKSFNAGKQNGNSGKSGNEEGPGNSGKGNEKSGNSGKGKGN
ncbi:MAG TPA: hypothetical protein VI564_05990 [Candidatus Nanoarchaeia archaeon]|nr:hypothetical protein [Candidatus Nanoarchaeia archaeon]